MSRASRKDLKVFTMVDSGRLSIQTALDANRSSIQDFFDGTRSLGKRRNQFKVTSPPPIHIISSFV
jgi:hypothetical protein